MSLILNFGAHASEMEEDDMHVDGMVSTSSGMFPKCFIHEKKTFT